MCTSKELVTMKADLEIIQHFGDDTSFSFIELDEKFEIHSHVLTVSMKLVPGGH